MLSSELLTSIQEGRKLVVVLLNNYGFQSIGGLSQAIGSGGFGTKYRMRNSKSGHLDGEYIPVDYAASARSLGAHVIEARDLTELKRALEQARKQTRTTVIVIQTDPSKRVPGYESWWDVPIAEVSEIDAVRRARNDYAKAKTRERYFL
jgi:3D-(3,5/4)-trihydroxycyclohexane-1,2-dione acylhydrolase (decyclizing)